MERKAFAGVACSACRAPLEPDDGHDECPSCLGVEHLRQGLTEHACLNCSLLPLDTRQLRLEQLQVGPSPPSVHAQCGQTVTLSSRKRKGAKARHGHPATKVSRRDPVALKVDSLASELDNIKGLLVALQHRDPTPCHTATAAQPPTVPIADAHTERQPPILLPVHQDMDDVMSTRASESLELYPEGYEQEGMEETGTQDAGLDRGSSTGTPTGSEASHVPASVRPVIKLALARLNLDTAPTTAPPRSAFFRDGVQSTSFPVPPSSPFVEELQRCWANPRQFTHLPSDCRALANMQDSAAYGLDRMPVIEPSVAALVLSPDEAMRPDARCPRPQCRVTDDLVSRSYDTAARIGRIGNSMSHLILALSSSLQDSEADPSARSLSDASLQAFAYMTRELGRLMSSLTLARRQIWLAQSPLLPPCKRALLGLPVIPGRLFGPAAQEALGRSLQVTEARRHFASLRREATARPWYNQRSQPPQRPEPAPRAQSSVQFRQPAASPAPNAAQRGRASGRRPSKPPRGKAGRY